MPLHGVSVGDVARIEQAAQRRHGRGLWGGVDAQARGGGSAAISFGGVGDGVGPRGQENGVQDHVVSQSQHPASRPASPRWGGIGVEDERPVALAPAQRQVQSRREALGHGHVAILRHAIGGGVGEGVGAQSGRGRVKHPACKSG